MIFSPCHLLAVAGQDVLWHWAKPTITCHRVGWARTGYGLAAAKKCPAMMIVIKSHGRPLEIQ